jgi:hypothetical protein
MGWGRSLQLFQHRVQHSADFDTQPISLKSLIDSSILQGFHKAKLRFQLVAGTFCYRNEVG